MKTVFVFVAAFLLKSSLIAQVIDLKQKRSDGDLKIENGSYQLYFNKTDVINAITFIDKTLNTNNSNLLNKIKANQIKGANLNAPSAENKDFTDLLTKNLGLYLLLKGKVTVYEGQKRIPKLALDEAPNERDLDGTITRTIIFTEENSEKQIFLGSMLAKLLE